MPTGSGSGPPGPLVRLARLLIRGTHAKFIQADLVESFTRDLERGLGRGRSNRRYARNVLASAWSVWTAGLTDLVTRGALVDARLGVRMLGRQPLLTAVAMLALGLGIPASLVVHHALDVVFSPLPVPEGHRVMGIRHWDLERQLALSGSVHDFVRWRESLNSFEAIGAARTYLVNVHHGDPGSPPVEAAAVTSSTFSLLRGVPLMGRAIAEADELRGAPDVVVLSEDFWTARFARDPDVLGTTVSVGPTQHTVVGVMPADFRFPDDNAVWLPLRAQPTDYPVGEGPALWIYGRLADGVTADEARLEMELVTDRAAADEPERLRRVVGEVVEMPVLFFRQNDFEDNAAIYVVQSLMLLLLLLVCGNVGTLILARTATRTAELAIRTALGASRWRIVTQLFIEALVLALAATGFGLLVMEGLALSLVRLLRPAGVVPYWVDPTLSPRIVLIALGLACVSAAVAGVIPALKATSDKVRANLQHAAAGNATIRFGFGSSALIVAEVVVSVGFLALGSLLVRSVYQDTDDLLGFEPERYASVSVRMPWLDPAEYPEYADQDAIDVRRRQTQQAVLARLFEEDDVVGAGMAIHHPAFEGAWRRLVLASPAGEIEVPRRMMEARVDAGFFRGLGRPVVAGRDFNASDAEPTSGARPVIVNERFVEDALGGSNAVGRRFRHATRAAVAPDEEDWFEIVGVVGSFGMHHLNPTHDGGYYLAMAPGEAITVRYLVEVAGEPEDFVRRFREIVAEVDPEATTGGRPLADIMATESRVLRGMFTLQILLAAVAFLLSITSLYALMSFTVAQRTREIGIRTALGAEAWGIVSTIARRAAVQLGIGLVLGSGWAWFLLRSMADDEIAVPVNVPLTIAVTVACAAAVGVVACTSPTLRALRVQPTEALRDL